LSELKSVWSGHSSGESVRNQIVSYSSEAARLFAMGCLGLCLPRLPDWDEDEFREIANALEHGSRHHVHGLRCEPLLKLRGENYTYPDCYGFKEVLDGKKTRI